MLNTSWDDDGEAIFNQDLGRRAVRRSRGVAAWRE